jgi:hypothetical protein
MSPTSPRETAPGAVSPHYSAQWCADVASPLPRGTEPQLSHEV